MKATALVAVFLILSVSLVGSEVVPTSAASCVQTGNPFGSIGTAWGTPGASLSVGPGEQDVPLTVSLLFYGPCTATATTFTLSLSQPLTSSNGKDSASAYGVNIAPDTIIQETFYLNVQGNASLKTYTLPLSIVYHTSANSTVLDESISVSIALKGNVVINFVPSTNILYAGQVNDLTLTTSNTGSGNATSVSVSVTPSSQVSVLSELGAIAGLPAGDSSSQTVELYVPQSLSGSTASLSFSATYYNSYSVSQTTSQVLEFEVASVNPASPYVLESAQWGTSTSSPQPGDENVPLVVNLQYMGTALVTDLRGTLTLPSGFTSASGNSSGYAAIPEVTANEGVTMTFYVDIGAQAKPGAYSFDLSLAWNTATSSNLHQSVILSPPAVGEEVNPDAISLSLSQLTDTVVAGTPSSVTFVLSNDGAASIYSAIFSVNVGSPLVVLGNSPSPPVTVVQPGKNASYTVEFGSSPSSSLGVYAGTVAVTFTNLDGVQQTQTFSVGLTLTGSIDIVVQDETVAQTSSGVTVSGSLLNEGSSSAYYVQVSGRVNNASSTGESPDYVGEVDPNTPTPFTLSIPYPAPGSAQPHAVVQLDITLQNSFGTSSTTTSSGTYSLESESQLFQSTGTSSSSGTGNSGANLVRIVSYSIVGVFVIAAAVVAVVVGRKRAAMRPKKEDKVI